MLWLDSLSALEGHHVTIISNSIQVLLRFASNAVCWMKRESSGFIRNATECWGPNIFPG